MLSDLDNSAKLTAIEEFVGGDEKGADAISEIREVFSLAGEGHLSVDASLARGLSYYTGVIYEVNVPDLSGSIASGGRYDGLIGMFGKEDIPAVGFSLGLERIVFVMEERGMFPSEIESSVADVLVTVWNDDSIAESLKLAGELRSAGLRVVVYPQADKLGKQFKYANQISTAWVCVMGDDELKAGKVQVKNMETGEQSLVERESVAGLIQGTAQ